MVKTHFLFFIRLVMGFLAFNFAHAHQTNLNAMPLNSSACEESIQLLVPKGEPYANADQIARAVEFWRNRAQAHLTYDPEKEIWKFTPEAVGKLKEERDHLRRQRDLAEVLWPETRHYVERLHMAQLLKMHLVAFGATSGGKSTIPERLLNHTVRDPRLGLEVPHFHRLDVQPTTTSADIGGYAFQGSLYFPRGLVAPHFALDEVDKAGFPFFGSVFPLLNERRAAVAGSSYQIPLSTAVVTMNAHPYEFLNRILRESGISLSSGLAFLNRITGSVLTDNNIRDADVRRARMMAAAGLGNRAGFREPIPFVDMTWFASLVDSSPAAGFQQAFPIKPTESTVAIADDVLHELRNWQKSHTQTEQQDQYMPMSAMVNNKTQIDMAMRTVSASILYDLLSLPENILSSADLAKLLEADGGIIYGADSLYRLHHLFTTATPGQVQFDLSKTELKFPNDRLNAMISETSETAPESASLRHIKSEHEMFATILQRKIEAARQSAAAVQRSFGDVLRSLGIHFAGHPPASLEEWIQQMKAASQMRP